MAKSKINIQAQLLKIAGIGGGAYASVKLNKLAFVKKQKPALVGVGKIIIGAFLPGFIGKGKQAGIAENVGDGFIAGGALDLASAFDKTLPSSLPATVTGVNDVMGRVVFDEDYLRNNVSGNNDVMGNADDVLVEY